MQPVPQAMELKHMDISKRDIIEGCTPEVNNKCQENMKKDEKTQYFILQAGKASLKLDPFERPSTKILQDLINSTLEYVSYPLCNHQGTALVHVQEINIGKTCRCVVSIIANYLITTKLTTMNRGSAAFNAGNMELLIMKVIIKNSFLIKTVH